MRAYGYLSLDPVQARHHIPAVGQHGTAAAAAIQMSSPIAYSSAHLSFLKHIVLCRWALQHTTQATPQHTHLAAMSQDPLPQPSNLTPPTRVWGARAAPPESARV
jgi:hypothetical protein